MILRLSRLFALAALGLGLAAPAVAGGRHHYHGRWHGHGHWGGPRVSVGIYGAPYGYYSPFYDPFYYPAPAVVYTRPVVVERGRPASVEVDVQRSLARRGYYGGVIDGDIGPRTRAAIRAYQVDRGLPVTGRIDGALLRSLNLL